MSRPNAPPLRFAVIGLNHRHIYHLVGGLLDAGAECAGYWSDTPDPAVLEGLLKRFPQLQQAGSRQALLDDASIALVVSAAVPAERADIAIAAMLHGKDALVDKPGVVSQAQLKEVQRVAAETRRRFTICFSERFIVPAVQVAQGLVAQGAIGEVVQTLGLGPHRLNRAIRPPWFWRKESYGGILVDIASHQIDQFLVFTGATEANIEYSHVGRFGAQADGDFENFGELLLKAGSRRGYVRVDWFTPDGLPTWGDGRLVILGTEGTIEIRKYIDIEGRKGTDHLFLSDQKGTRYIDCSAEPLTFFRQTVADVRDRTETAVGQAHVFTVTRLALEAQAFADRAARS